MPMHRRSACRWLLVVMMLGTSELGNTSRAQDVGQPPEKAPARRRANDWSAHFDHWVFAPFGNEAAMRADLDARLAARIRDLDQAYGLSAAQEKKLRLAARAEIRSLFDSVGELRKRFELVNDDFNQVERLLLEMNLEREALFSDPLGERSFLEKVLAKTLVGEQSARYEEVVRERTLAPYREWIDVLIEHESQGLGLSPAQRRRLAELLRDESRPLRKAGSPSYEDVILRVAALPEARLRTVVDDAQWRRLQRSFAVAKLDRLHHR